MNMHVCTYLIVVAGGLSMGARLYTLVGWLDVKIILTVYIHMCKKGSMPKHNYTDSFCFYIHQHIF